VKSVSITDLASSHFQILTSLKLNQSFPLSIKLEERLISIPGIFLNFSSAHSNAFLLHFFIRSL
jgi:hypothetical protein